MQSSHACIQASRDSLLKSKEHPSLVVLGVRDEDDLKAHAEMLREKGIRHSVFYESDLCSKTALATECIVREEDRRIFRKLNLIK